MKNQKVKIIKKINVEIYWSFKSEFLIRWEKNSKGHNCAYEKN